MRQIMRGEVSLTLVAALVAGCAREEGDGGRDAAAAQVWMRVRWRRP